MQNEKGVFVVIEGVDGSGKSTQFNMLAERLTDAGYDVATFKFPRYDHASSYFVKQYLAGAYGSANEVGPYTASLFYALDRYAAADEIRTALELGKIVLVDRYTGSNMAHQGTKFYHADQRRGYFIWLDNLEFEMLRIPRPDVNFVLHVPAEVSETLLTKTDKKRDIHETDGEHLKRSVEVYNDLCQLFPKDFSRIDCVRSGEMLPVETINNLIWEKVFPLLPTQKKSRKANAKVETPTAATALPADGARALKTEPAVHVTPAFGEDARDIPAALHVVVENCTSLAAQKFEEGQRPARSNPFIYEEKDEHSQYRYHTPGNLKGQTAVAYRERMDKIFDNYSEMVRKLTERAIGPGSEQSDTRKTAMLAQARSAARAVLPVAAKSSVDIFVPANAFEDFAQRLLNDSMAEVRATGKEILSQARQVAPTLLENGGKLASGRSDIKQLTETYLPDGYAAGIVEPVTLTNFWPRNELDLVSDMVYKYSNLPFTELQGIVDKWPYQQKAEVFTTYASGRPGRIFEKVHYCWDVVSNFDSFRDVTNISTGEAMRSQPLTPRYGYEVPELIEDVGLADMFEECFDISLELHSILEEAGLREEAQYATLLGHRMRWHVAYNARDLYKLRTQVDNPEARKLVTHMRAKLAEVHPMLAESMKFAPNLG